MRWPWQRRTSDGRLVIGRPGGDFAWLQADAGGRLVRGGLLRADGGDAAALAQRVRGIGLPAAPATAVLGLADAQLLQLEAPAVKPDELKAAARWKIKDLVDGHVDDLTIDVLHVGADADRARREIFVAAARNTLIRELSNQAEAMGLALAVVDIAETAQRNLQTAAAEAAGLAHRATAALVRHGEHCLLTIGAGGELYDSRRLAWDDAGLQATDAAAAPAAPMPDLEGLDFIDYGAMSGPDADPGAPRLVLEVQRSFDVWERTWTELPLAALFVHAGDDTGALADRLAASLALPVAALDPQALFPGFDAVAPTAAERAALLPLLGALRRGPERAL